MGAGEGSGGLQQSEEAPSSNYAILFDTIASFALLVFSSSSSCFLLLIERLPSQECKW